jgi:hypothetical protein
MTKSKEFEMTMQVVTDAHRIIRRFHKNLADLFRTISIMLEEATPSYESLYDDLLITLPSGKLSKSERWLLRHFGMAFHAEPDDPFLLFNVSLDTQFNDKPELWLGIIHDLKIKTAESYPWEDSIEAIYNDYFAPEEKWREIQTWYQDLIEDDQYSAKMQFCRVPLYLLDGIEAIENNIYDKIFNQIKTL